MATPEVPPNTAAAVSYNGAASCGTTTSGEAATARIAAAGTMSASPRKVTMANSATAGRGVPPVLAMSLLKVWC